METSAEEVPSPAHECAKTYPGTTAPASASLPAPAPLCAGSCLALERLRDALRPLTAGGIALAYSGGVDSSLLLSVLEGLRRETPFPFLVLTMRSPFNGGAVEWRDGGTANGIAVGDTKVQGSVSPAEVRGNAPRTCSPSPSPHPTAPSPPHPSAPPSLQIPFDPFAVPGLRQNPPDRCYWCKRAFMGRFVEIAQAHGLATLMDGTNADDLLEPRPGLRALRELGVRSLLAELGITKASVRAMAAALRLPCANAPSSPCLATRFPYGTELTETALHAVAAGETLIRRFLPPTAPLRLRVHGDLARIETSPEAFPMLLAVRAELLDGLSSLGFRHITLDLAGYRLTRP